MPGTIAGSLPRNDPWLCLGDHSGAGRSAGLGGMHDMPQISALQAPVL